MYSLQVSGGDLLFPSQLKMGDHVQAMRRLELDDGIVIGEGDVAIVRDIDGSAVVLYTDTTLSVAFTVYAPGYGAPSLISFAVVRDGAQVVRLPSSRGFESVSSGNSSWGTVEGAPSLLDE